MLARLIRRNDDTRHRVAGLYMALVEQARRPTFYTVCGVPDSVWGRFDMIVLHAFLVFRRLQRDGERHAGFAQALFDHMFADIDQNLRELGVGDLSVGKKIKQMAQSFYGRVAAYENGLASPDDGALEAALARNLFNDAAPTQEQLALMAGYLRREAGALDVRPIDDLLAGRVRFGPPPGAMDETP